MRRWMAVVAVIALVAAACDSDDDAEAGGEEPTSEEAASEVSACDAFVAFQRAFDIEEDLAAGVAALADFAAAAPAEVASEVEPMIPLIEENPEAALESEEVAAGEAAADAYALEHCSDQRVDLKAFDYAYGDAPRELDAGRVVVNFTNESESGEFHEALLLRKNDDAADPANELVAGALEGPTSVEATMGVLEQFRFDAVGFLEPGATDVFAADLDAGEYIFVCLLPVDSAEALETYFGGGELDGEQHFDRGMYAEFTVS